MPARVLEERMWVALQLAAEILSSVAPGASSLSGPKNCSKEEEADKQSESYTVAKTTRRRHIYVGSIHVKAKTQRSFSKGQYHCLLKCI
jgi:hypothetical protein